MKTAQDFTVALNAVSDPARRRILQLLKQRGCCSIGKSTGLCACDVESRMKLSQPTISHHMRVLTGAAAFRPTTDVDRQFEVIDMTVFEPGGWVPRGRDTELEQLILQRLKSCM